MHGRPTNDPPRKRRWNHQLWQDGPKDVKLPPPAAAATKPAATKPAATPATKSSPGSGSASGSGGPRQSIAANLPNGRDAASRAASSAAVDTCSRSTFQLGRSKLFMPDRGVCMTPSIRANGPSYMKPVPPPVQRPRGAPPGANGGDRPLVIIRTVAGRQLVVAASTAAAACGVRPGLTLTEARALCPGLANFDEDPLRDARALEALARWMTRFTPIVSTGRTEDCGLRTEARPLSPQSSVLNTIFLDVTGCARAFGGTGNIVRGVRDALGRWRLDAGVAVAPTPGGAWALASFAGDSDCIVERDELPTALAPLPVAGLRLDDDLLASLHHLGVETIGQLMDLPRAALPSRFGPALLRRLDQALGRVDEPLVPLPYHAPVEARVDFDGVVDALETIHLVFRELVGQVADDLARRGCGARQVDVEFSRAYAQTLRRTIALSRPSRDPVNLFNLIRCATETLDGGGDGGSDNRGGGGGDGGGGSDGNVDGGFLGIRLSVPRFERVADEQVGLLDHERHAGEVEFQQLVERLCVRMGDSAVARPVLVESHVPEKAFTARGLGAWSLRQTIVGGPPERFRGAATPPMLGQDAQAASGVSRPLHLLPMPVEIRAMVSPSEDRDGRPVLFRHGSDVHHLTHAVGPERIAGEWWRGHDRTRDYFDVEDREGKRFWVFRVNETGKWYLHGVF